MSLTWIFSCTLFLLLLKGTGSAPPLPKETSTYNYTITVTLDDSNSSSTALPWNGFNFHNLSGTLDVEKNLTAILNYAHFNHLSLKLNISSENNTIFQLEKCCNIIGQTSLNNSDIEVFMGRYFIEYLLSLAGSKCSFENFDFYLTMSSKQNSSGQISIQSSDHILPARSENSSDQVVYIDQHFRKHVVHQVELGGLVDVALDEANEFTVFLVANLSKPAEIFISKCGITTIRLNTTVNETVEFSRDQLERLRITTDMACSENMNSTFIDISVKCEERINGTVIFGLAYPKNHLTWIATIVWFAVVGSVIIICGVCKEWACGCRKGRRISKNRQKRIGQGKYKTDHEILSLGDGNDQTEEIEMEEFTLPKCRYVPNSLSTEQELPL